ncbi:unnamed protein product [Rhizoctonia solani]|uniref:BTB domain-containing protein n=1 Tax=Rhizoctonia solani TaxID=456999 RepID=A0A8H2WZI4_9AGAM|nr:unnamed protein product [Rhizoctonia solani]
MNRVGSDVFVGSAYDAGYHDHPNEITETKVSNPIVHHPEFFLDNTLIAIQIENTLFNVHKYQLAKSEVFSNIFKMPKHDDGEPEAGSSPEHPIMIHGAAASDFAALLKILYASHFSSNPPTLEVSLIVPAFRAASLLGFSELHTYLLPLAEKNLDDVDKVVFAREFGIKEWVVPALIRLCKREAVLGTEEARKLGVDSVLLIWRVREQHRIRTSPVVGNYYCNDCTGLIVNGVSATCSYCRTKFGYLYRAGTIATNPNTYDPALEVEVAKWVEDGYAAKGR